jgi:hypothetical protein
VGKALALAAFLLVASAAHGAESLSDKIHSDPAKGDNLRVYAFVDAPSLTFVLDGGSVSRLDGMSVVFTRVEPGQHKAGVTLPDGDQATLTFALSADRLIESKGRRWWCLLAGRRSGQLTLTLATTAQCKDLTDSGPD